MQSIPFSRLFVFSAFFTCSLYFMGLTHLFHDWQNVLTGLSQKQISCVAGGTRLCFSGRTAPTNRYHVRKQNVQDVLWRAQSQHPNNKKSVQQWHFICLCYVTKECTPSYTISFRLVRSCMPWWSQVNVLLSGYVAQGECIPFLTGLTVVKEQFKTLLQPCWLPSWSMILQTLR